MPQIYVIYRPEDTRKKSKDIIDALKKTYGESNIIYPDYDGYVDVYQIEQAVQKSHYLLVVIGNYWADLVDESGQNLLASVYDPVHMAIATAIKSRKRVVPILVDGASMPSRQRLPRELRPMITQDAVKLDKNSPIAKSLNKGLKDIIKRDTFIKIPDFMPTKKVSKPVQPRQTQPRLRQPVPEHDWQTQLHRARLPIVIFICVLVIVITMMMMVLPTTSTRRNADRSVITPVLATIAPTSTIIGGNSTITESPNLIPTVIYPRITRGNASQLAPISSQVVSIATSQQSFFSQDQTLLIVAASELQEVYIIDVDTSEILFQSLTSPVQPISIELTSDETLLHVLMSDGQVWSWAVQP